MLRVEDNSWEGNHGIDAIVLDSGLEVKDESDALIFLKQYLARASKGRRTKKNPADQISWFIHLAENAMPRSAARESSTSSSTADLAAGSKRPIETNEARRPTPKTSEEVRSRTLSVNPTPPPPPPPSPAPVPVPPVDPAEGEDLKAPSTDPVPKPEATPDSEVKPTPKTALPPAVDHIPATPSIEAFPSGELEIGSFEARVAEQLHATRNASGKSQEARTWGDVLQPDHLVALPEEGKQLRAPTTRPESIAPPLIRGFASGSEPNLIYLVGDIHGDLLALETAIQCILHDTKTIGDQAESPIKRSIILLGDLIDDGPESHLVLERVRTWATEHPDEIILIPGNHDLALKSLNDGTFKADVSPCEFADWLNDAEDKATEAHRQLAREFVQYCQNDGPAAIILPDRTLAVHGGVPHTGLWNHLMDWHTDGADLQGITEQELAQRVLDDFAWGRVHSRAKRKFPDPSSRSQEIGSEDVKQSLGILGHLLGGESPIRVIRGHDHKEERYEVPKKHENRVVTINTMSYRQGREHLGPPTREPVIARWRKLAGGQPPSLTLLQVKLRPDFVTEHAPELRARASESNAK